MFAIAGVVAALAIADGSDSSGRACNVGFRVKFSCQFFDIVVSRRGSPDAFANA